MTLKEGFFLTPLVLALSLVACSPKKDASFEKDPVDGAVRKLDEGDVNGAIADLEDLAGHDARPLVKQTLASAYAARAGLRVENYWGFLVGFRAPLVNLQQVENSGSFSQVRRIIAQLNGQVETKEEAEGLGRLAKVFGTMELWQERINELPTVSGAEREDIQKAIDVLADTPTRGGHLYRALLGLVTFKSDLANGFTGWTGLANHLKQFDLKHPKAAKNSKILCDVDVRSFANWSAAVVARLASTAEDIAGAYPAKESEIQGAVQSSSVIVQSLRDVGGNACL